MNTGLALNEKSPHSLQQSIFTMSAIAKLTERLDAFAAKVETLEAEVKTLRSMTPLEAFTAGLKDASPEAIVEWITLCQEMAATLAPEAVPVAAKTKANAKPRAITNASGPKEWNVFVQSTWQSMAAEKGILYEDFEGESKDKDFKEATKKEGITYQSAMKEASRRKALAEGKDAVPKAPKAAKAAKAELKDQVPKAAVPKAAASVGGASAKAAVPKAAALETVAEAEEAEEAEAEAEETEEERTHREAQEAGWVQIQHNGSLHYKDVDCGEVYSFPKLDVVGVFQKDGKFQPY